MTVACDVLGYKSSCPPSESGNYGLENIQSINNEEHTHFLASTHYGSEEHEYQALEPGHQPQSYLENSPEFYAANNLIETKYNPHYVKNYVRGECFEFCPTITDKSDEFPIIFS